MLLIPERNHDFMQASIIILTKNSEATLDSCIRSIMKQTHTGFELIVVDGGSTDNTLEIAHKYGAKVLQEREGVGYARALGCKAASGNYVVFIDSDCIAGRRWLDCILKPFKHKDVGIVYGFTSSVKSSSLFAEFERARIKRYYERRGGVVEPSSWNAAYRRTALMEIGNFDPLFRRTAEDIDAYYRLLGKGWGVVFQPQAVIYHRHRVGLMQLLVQHLHYGQGRAMLIRKHGLKKIAPLIYSVLVLSIWSSGLVAPGLLLPLWALFLLTPYALPLGLASLKETRRWSAALIPIIEFLRASSFAFGLMVGLLEMPWQREVVES
jgi:glycosyltransferase involved in cell wall biosynthesis